MCAAGKLILLICLGRCAYSSAFGFEGMRECDIFEVVDGVRWCSIGYTMKKTDGSSLLSCDSTSCGTLVLADNFNLPSFEGVNSLVINVEYNTPVPDEATYCEIPYRWECMHTLTSYSSWLDANGVAQDWSVFCTTSVACACEANDNVWRENVGTISSNSYSLDSGFPPSAFRYGDLSSSNEQGKLTLGLLKCRV